MILTGPAIRHAVDRGEITIDPFDPDQLNPNSYNYRLGDVLKVAVGGPADPRQDTELETIRIPSSGFELQPGTVYLGATVERIGSPRYVASLIGRSSLGRLGCFLQISADLAQLGALHRWTLEIVVVQHLTVYAGMRMGQVSFWERVGAGAPYVGYYGRLDDPSPCSPSALAGIAVQEGSAA
ncbi:MULTISPECIES: dCTP deaminase [unclassified Streptomyces]|uniref:dCTP deaminase n=1 Tax=unclassified Streptomyces TaxID=2593676 RepID=UPI002E2D3804|nr:deoxycytidine deaminase [Streptomyces sp. NBC_00223]